MRIRFPDADYLSLSFSLLLKVEIHILLLLHLRYYIISGSQSKANIIRNYNIAIISYRRIDLPIYYFLLKNVYLTFIII